MSLTLLATCPAAAPTPLAALPTAWPACEAAWPTAWPACWTLPLTACPAACAAFLPAPNRFLTPPKNSFRILSDTTHTYAASDSDRRSILLWTVFYSNNNWTDKQCESPYLIENTQELKTTWHPTEI